MWLYSDIADLDGISPGDNNWVVIPNSNVPYYNPGCLTQSRWFTRCSRRIPCIEWAGESTVICVIVKPVPVVALASSIQACAGPCTGSVSIQVSGVPSYTVNWTKNGEPFASNVNALNNLCNGTYCFTVDANGCTKSDCFVVNIPDLLEADAQSSNNTCNEFNNPGGCDGVAMVSISGGTSPYTVNWSNGDEGGEITNLCAGIYTYTVTDANGCTTEGEVEIGEPEPFFVTSICGCNSLIKCAGDCNASLNITVVGNYVPALSFAWSNGATTEDVSGLCAGQYNVTVTDGNGCIYIQFHEPFVEPDALVAVISASTKDNCFTSTVCEGSATVSVSGGTAPYTYLWSNGSTNATATGLCATNIFYVTVTDAHLCETVTQILISCDEEICQTLTASVEKSNATDCEVVEVCDIYNYNYPANTGNDHAIWLNFDGTGAQRYYFEGPGKLHKYNNGTAKITGTIYNVLDNAKKWNVQVWFKDASDWATWSALGRGYKDEANVAGSDYTTWTYYIMDPSKPNVFTGDGFYYGKSISLTHMPSDYHFGLQIGEKANSKNTYFGMSSWFYFSGDYSGHGDFNTRLFCTTSVCNGSATVTPSNGTGPFTYVWSASNIGNTNTANNLCPGNYSVTFTDANGCTGSANFTIGCDIVPPPPSCDGFRTQTQGGWGTSANGNNPGVYRNANFAAAFPNGLTIGCNNTLKLTTPQAVQDFLPSSTTPAILNNSYVNPGSSYKNVFAGQVVALTLSVTFDLYDPNFGSSTTNLKDLIYNQAGPFQGWTVQQILNAANNLIGGCPSPYTPADLNEAVDNINNNYVDGTTNLGYLSCPTSARVEEESTQPSVIMVQNGQPQIVVYPNPMTDKANIDFITPSDEMVTLEVFSITGVKVADLFRGQVKAGVKQSVTFNNDNYAEGMYIYRLTTSEGAFTGNIVIVR